MTITKTHKSAATAALLSALLTMSGCGEGPDASQHIARAKLLLEQGDTAGQVIELKNALQRDPNHAEARMLLGMTYLDLNQSASAIKELKRARELGAAPGPIAVALIKALILDSQYQEALDEIEVIPDSVEPATRHALTGRAHLGLKEIEDAEVAFRRALEIDDDEENARLGLASIAVYRQDFDTAMSELDALLSSIPNHIQALLMKGELLLVKEQPAEAEAVFQAVIDTNSQLRVLSALTGVARAKFARNDLDGARQMVTKALDLAPKDPLSNYLAGVLAYSEKQLDVARDALRNVLRINPEHPKTLLLMGVIQFEKEQFAQAEKNLETYLRTDPAHLPARKLLAAVKIHNRRAVEAIQVLEVVMAQGLQDAQYLAMLGNAYMQNRQLSKATEMLRKASEIAPDTAAIQTQLAVSHLVAGSRTQAISELETAVGLDQNLIQADILLILTSLQDQKFDEALTNARRLTEKYPDNAIGYNLLGAALLAKEERDAARTQFEHALEKDPGFSSAVLNLARLDIADGDQSRARARMEEALGRNPADPELLTALARLVEQEGNRDKAIEYLQTARKENPGAIPPRLLLGSYFSRSGQHDSALEIADELEDLDSENTTVLAYLGEVRLSAGKTDDAAAAFQRLTSLLPDSASAWLHYGRSLVAKQDLPGARKAFEKATELSDGKTALYALGQVALSEGNLDDAETISRELRDSFADNPDGYALLGDVYMARKSHAEAIINYRKALERSNNTVLMLKLRNAYLLADDDDSAAELIGNWVKKYPEDKRARLVLAAANQKIGERNSAMNHYLELLKSQPENAIALNNLAWIYHEKGDAKSLEFAERALRAAPDSPEIMDTVGWLRLQNDQIEQGLRMLEKSVDGRPGNLEIRYHYAVALARSGDKQQAIRNLEQVLEPKTDFSARTDAEELLKSLR